MTIFGSHDKARKLVCLNTANNSPFYWQVSRTGRQLIIHLVHIDLKIHILHLLLAIITIMF